MSPPPAYIWKRLRRGAALYDDLEGAPPEKAREVLLARIDDLVNGRRSFPFPVVIRRHAEGALVLVPPRLGKLSASSEVDRSRSEVVFDVAVEVERPAVSVVVRYDALEAAEASGQDPRTWLAALADEAHEASRRKAGATP